MTVLLAIWFLTGPAAYDPALTPPQYPTEPSLRAPLAPRLEPERKRPLRRTKIYGKRG